MKKTLLILAILSGLSGRYMAERQALLACDLSAALWGQEAGHKTLIYWNQKIYRSYGCSPRLAMRLAREAAEPHVSVALLTIQRNACRIHASTSELAEVEQMLHSYEALVD